MSKQIELLKKIQELANRGEGGEALNAKTLLDAMLKKHNLTLEDLEGDKVEYHYMKIDPKKKDDIRFLHQVIKSVNYHLKLYILPAKKVKEFRTKGNCLIECTIAQFIEIEQKYTVFHKLFKKEYEVFFTAFCKANDLLITSPESKSFSDLTLEEQEEWQRINKMSQNIKSETINKQLSCPK